MNAILLSVKTAEFTRALRHLCKVEKSYQSLVLAYVDRVLTLSLGRTEQGIHADGFWPERVSVHRQWAETLSTRPYDVAVMTLSVREGKLWGRDHGLDCSVGDEPVLDENAIKRQGDIEAAVKSLERYGVTETEVKALIDGADVSQAAVWEEADEARIVRDIAGAWISLFSYGIQPSDIRRALHKKTRDLWKNPPGRR